MLEWWPNVTISVPAFLGDVAAAASDICFLRLKLKYVLPILLSE
jgi:hypothetical protein